jgi:hypothetical protein
MDFARLIRKPTAWLPLALSLGVAAMLLTAFLRHELVPTPDEDSYAHLFQIAMGAQLPIIGWFAIQWVPQAPKPAALVLALQIAAALAVCSPVYFLGL